MNTLVQLHSRASTDAETTLHTIQIFADCIADQMKKAYGGDWRIQIDEEGDFVMVARRLDKGITQPKRGEVV